jgi:hypothetical protein
VPVAWSQQPATDGAPCRASTVRPTAARDRAPS